MCSNLGVVIGPLLGGLLADPASNYPKIFGGIPWLIKFPYSPPSLLSALFLVSIVCAVFFCLKEVGDGIRELHTSR
jgi:MFS family permease